MILNLCVAKAALTHRSRDTRPLVSYGVWNWDTGSGSFGSCGFGGGVFMHHTCSCVYHRCLSDWDLGNLGIGSTPWALCPICWVIPKQCLWFVRAHCPSGDCHCEVPLPGGRLHGLLKCLGGWCMSSRIHTNTRTQNFPGEHYIVMRWSMLITSAVSGLNIMADRCMLTVYLYSFCAPLKIKKASQSSKALVTPSWVLDLQAIK